MPQKQHVFLLSDIDFAPSQSDDELRDFKGVANSGKPFSYYGQQTIVDLSDISFEKKKPVLHLHKREERAGHGYLSVDSNELLINGKLLRNKHAKEIAQDADDGFPWQMSAHVIAEQVDEIAHGKTEVVNGQTVTGPMFILRQCTVSEVSFTPTGVDSSTSAVVLGDDGKPQLSGSVFQSVQLSSTTPNETNEDNTMTLEEALEKIKKLEADKEALQKENDELKAKNKQSDVDAQLSQAGFKRSDGKSYDGVSDATYNMLLSADDDNTKALIADLSKSLQLSEDKDGDKKIPGFLLGEQHPPSQSNQGGVQLSENPLVADAQARGQEQKGFL